MSITVRLWSEDDLKIIKSGVDPWLSTIFMNANTFSVEEIGVYPYEQRKTYVAYYDGIEEPVEFYATDDDMAQRFFAAEYSAPLLHLVEVIMTSREVEL
jgi:hypothetical protein